ncbi:MAG: DUF982 domain-containing protein [Mesorhizobium sp.]|nr:DUF982 domain-containing protein [Mesorhizobium sp.]MCO5161509.1 DUF982 domain-containing protein [Mesorhizobium sp.]
MSHSEPKRFATPVIVLIEGRDVIIEGAAQAAALLADVRWPGRRDDLHAEALETCLKVLEGHRSTEDARARLVDAALAAGIYSNVLR